MFALLCARYWLTVYPHVVVHVRRARACARSIADPALRALALQSLAKRSNLDGAAAFAALAPRRARTPVVRALLAFQSLYNYADVLAEQGANATFAQARDLHLPLLCALGDARPTAPPPLGPSTGERGYALELAIRCQEAIARLPSAAVVREAALDSAREIALFQAHSRPAAEPGELERWARGAPPRAAGLQWWESAAARGSSLAVHALIAAAATPALERRTARRLADAYGGRIAALHTLLDSLVDRDEDALLGQPSLIACYPSRDAAARAMGELARGAMRDARSLPQGARHSVLVAAMAGLYLSVPEARTPSAAPVAGAVRAAIGGLAAPVSAVFAVACVG